MTVRFSCRPQKTFSDAQHGKLKRERGAKYAVLVANLHDNTFNHTQAREEMAEALLRDLKAAARRKFSWVAEHAKWSGAEAFVYDEADEYSSDLVQELLEKLETSTFEKVGTLQRCIATKIRFMTREASRRLDDCQ